jgi:uncharacterized protein (DUF169 family)
LFQSRRIVQLKSSLNKEVLLIFEETTEKIKKGKYVAGFDDYKEKKVKTSWFLKHLKMYIKHYSKL